MKRTFITSISLQRKQGREGLEKVIYEPQGFSINNNPKTSFPIIPIMAENMGTNPDLVEIIAILPGIDNAKTNYHFFEEEVLSLGLSKDKIKVINIGDDFGQEGSVRVLLNLIDNISDDSICYMDITYNAKSLSAMQLYAARLVEKIKDSEVVGIYYGENIPGTTEVAKLHDINIFKQIADFTDQLDLIGIEDIRAALGKIIGENK